MDTLLSVDGLDVRFRGHRRSVHAAKSVSFDIARGEFFGLVGESGSGKSVTSLSLTRLLPFDAEVSVSGSALYHGRGKVRPVDLLSCPEDELMQVRRSGISYVFQDPVEALNPYLPIGDQMRRLLRHLGTEKPIDRHSRYLLERVRIDDARRVLASYPRELSGGMCQRVAIAFALASEPQLIVADEPTTDLDVIVRNTVLDLLRDLVGELSLSIILITHDMGVVRHYCDSIAVMNRGEIVERGSVMQVFTQPQTDYTRMLLDSVPRIRSEATT